MNMNDYSVMKARVEACEMMRESLAVQIADKVANNEAPGESGTVSSNSRSPARAIPLPSWDEFNDFITAQGLDYTDAREWWEMTIVDRDGKDRYGKPIANWKAACRKFCAAKTQRRNA